jgi:N-acetylmuramoyl-L-alanine amidase
MSRLVQLVVVSLLLAGCGADFATRGVVSDGAAAPSTTEAVAAAASTTTVMAVPDTGVVVIPAGGAGMAAVAGGAPDVVAHEGLTFGFFDRDGEHLAVIDTCNEELWVAEADVDVYPHAVRQSPGPGFDLSRAVVVVDPGHGGIDWGGVGERSSEKAVNLDISERLRRLLLASHDIDWQTGDISTGPAYPGVSRVFLTRDASGPDDGDYRLLLGHRAAVANGAGADALVSIHNNTVPRIDTDIPGTEVYYSVATEGSDRLASLIYDELLRSFRSFDAPWRGGPFLGARARIEEDGTDYYGLLRRAEMPAVIVEGVYISEPAEEALLSDEAFRQAYAEGVYRGIVRFLTTEEALPEHINDPELFTDDAGAVSSSNCSVPVQPREPGA